MPTAKPKQTKKQRKSRLEEEYLKFFRYLMPAQWIEEGSLEQPSPLKVVPSVATYGAYEEPIVEEPVVEG